MLINYFNLNLIKLTVNNIYNEGETHTGRVPSVDEVTPYHFKRGHDKQWIQETRPCAATNGGYEG